MDTKKLEKWASLLLDTGKRNNLVNFRDTKVSTLEIILPSASELFDKIETSFSLEVYNPEIIDTTFDYYFDYEPEDGEEETEKPVKLNREEYLAKYCPKIKKSRQILLYNPNVSPVTALKNIDKKARAYIEETGNNVAYLAFGFIHWNESDESRQFFRAPVLLVPVKFRNDSAIDPWYVEMSEDEILLNPVFSYKIQAERGIVLPEYEDGTLYDYLSKIESMVGKLGWTVSHECKIGIFSFNKLNMYKDLMNNKEAILRNANIRKLLGESSENDGFEFDESEYRLSNPLIELHNVVDADSSQIEAIEMAKAGKSFVLQGPPGTGKSQTITNIIAECLYDGKKVLFVSEKQAALNVVFEKLKKARLDEFCLELHSYKANKKEVIDNLCKTMSLAKTTVSNIADEKILSKEKSQKILDSYEVELHKKREGINRSLYQLYSECAACRDAKEVKLTLEDIESKDEDYLRSAINLLEQYVDFIPSIGYQYKNNPWYGYNNPDTNYQTYEKAKESVGIMADVFGQLANIETSVAEKYGVNLGSISKAAKSGTIFLVAARCNLITPTFFERERFDYIKEELWKMGVLARRIISLKSEIEEKYDEEIYVLDGGHYHYRLTGKYKSFTSRILSGEYKDIMSDLRFYSKSRKKVSYDEAVRITQKLSIYRQLLGEYAEMEGPVKSSLGTLYTGYDSDWEKINNELYYFGTALQITGDLPKISCMDNEEYQKCRDEFDLISYDLKKVLNESKVTADYLAGCFDTESYDIYNADLAQSRDKMTACKNESNKLENWSRFNRLYMQMHDLGIDRFVDAAIAANVPSQHIPISFKYKFYEQWVDCIIHSSDELLAFNRITHDKQVENFVQLDKLQFNISISQIRAKLAAKRPSLEFVSAKSPAAILMREGKKKRKQKSVRNLLDELGTFIQELKPCFLMSPQSVSTFLTQKSIKFDLVVFDEASQIFPQDAVGSIYRADKMIVVGDSKQMPPSNFFVSTAEVHDDDEETGDVTDFESILDICAASVSQKRLRWHYRSRFEELIAFSNKNFYDNELITFPSSITKRNDEGVEFFYVDGGSFDHHSKTNRKEAEYIVDLIFKNIEKHPDRSLGVVAFSVSQQDLIDNLLSKRRETDPSKEYFFRKDAEEPFFVKNLETVQGDERDTIIFSVGYAKDSAGKLLHNFGPLNKVGGERRLNVAVTRAKISVQLVASIKYMDIDLSRTRAEGSRLLREYLDYAENGTIALDRSVEVDPFERFDSPFEEEVCEFLRSKGYKVDTQVGCSQFRIDLGLRRPDTSDYLLAIECDGATYHSSKNARDRDRLRQEILESMGWKFYRIWSTDWFRNKAVEKERLLEAVKNAINDSRAERVISAKNDFKDSLISEDDTFEGEIDENDSGFPVYTLANDSLNGKSFDKVVDIVLAVLEIEAPVNEGFLLKRIVKSVFGKDKVTSTVKSKYEYFMKDCIDYGIIRRNGFLYLKDRNSYVFRIPGDDPGVYREIKEIAPEELAAGMRVIIEQNVSIDKDGLYRTVARLQGFQRSSPKMVPYLDSALQLLNNSIEISGNMIKLKSK